ncbi:TonB-dependent receptor [Parvularcula marina]|uniref:TonB-dependent receptor n=2 Tax=Parvularcula marina TaxID=2292771 RepID=A0A371RII9_9PROT|nr:TonB-dependent receptor [Parvularcula marina]
MGFAIVSYSILAGALMAGASLIAAAAAETVPANADIDLITVTGSRPASEIAGAVDRIDADALRRFEFADINRILRQVPGLNIQEEDGFGLRPNIGIRGSGADRSSKIVIMEDGVPVAPAPYAAPSAYYFPTAGRMNAIEIVKGPGAVRYGPNTTAGAIQFFSTPIPEEAAGHITAFVSDTDRTTVHAYAGKRWTADSLPVHIGGLIEFYSDESDGFKKITRGETGFDITDFVTKLGFYSKPGAAAEQSLVFKYQHSEQTSDETYLGLTEADFARSPYQRYAASQLDQFQGDHDTYQATHNITFGNGIKLNTIAYRTDFARNWRKLDAFDNSALSESGDCNSLNEILIDPLACELEFRVLAGPQGYVSPDDVLGLRHNNRDYYAAGIQSAIGFSFEGLGASHDLTASIRYHEDEQDRFQQQDQYRMDNGTLVLTTDNAPGTQSNRLSTAEAWSGYLEDIISFGKTEITAGIRIENVETMETRWSGADRTDATISRERSNSYTELLPSLAVLYRATPELSVFAGVHRGFAAAGVGSSEDTDPEESWIYEVGGRYTNGPASIETIYFFNDYSNLIGACTNSTGGSGCDIGDSFNAGEVDVYGLEVTASTDFAHYAQLPDMSLPVAVTYTWTESELQSSFDSGFFGTVIAGDELPYVPEHQLTVSAGIEQGAWRLDAIINHVSETRNVAGGDPIPASEEIDARTLVDLSASYEVTEHISLLLKAENLFDEEYLAARRPYGLRPGKPREVFAGLRIDF